MFSCYFQKNSIWEVLLTTAKIWKHSFIKWLFDEVKVQKHFSILISFRRLFHTSRIIYCRSYHLTIMQNFELEIELWIISIIYFTFLTFTKLSFIVTNLLLHYTPPYMTVIISILSLIFIFHCRLCHQKCLQRDTILFSTITILINVTVRLNLMLNILLPGKTTNISQFALNILFDWHRTSWTIQSLSYHIEVMLFVGMLYTI